MCLNGQRLDLLLSRGGVAGWSCWPACGGTCGGARSRDLDLCCLLERPRCSTDDDGPADGDEDSKLWDPHPVQ